MSLAVLTRPFPFNVLDGSTIVLSAGTVIEIERLVGDEGFWVKSTRQPDYRRPRLKQKFFRLLSPLEMLAREAG